MREFGLASTHSSTATLTVLLVEDSATQREATRSYLEMLDDASFSVLEATTGNDGLDILTACHVDCILLDFDLPDMNGLEFMDALFTLPLHFRPPVIVVTGQGNETIAVQALKNGADDYVVKGDRGKHFELLPLVIQKAYQERLLQYEKSQLDSMLWENLQSKDMLLEAIGDGAIGLSGEGVVMFMNPVAAQQLRQDAVHAVGQPLSTVLARAGVGEAAQGLLRLLDKAERGNGCFTLNPQRLGGSQDTDRISLCYAVFPVMNKNNMMTGTLILLREGKDACMGNCPVLNLGSED